MIVMGPTQQNAASASSQIKPLNIHNWISVAFKSCLPLLPPRDFKLCRSPFFRDRSKLLSSSVAHCPSSSCLFLSLYRCTCLRASSSFVSTQMRSGNVPPEGAASADAAPPSPPFGKFGLAAEVSRAGDSQAVD